MATFNLKTKTQVNIDKKPRVYFTCHPDDFEKYFDKICEDIFKTHDCVIYYTEDMNERIADDEKEVDLGRNNLFVVPVTFKLLSTPNRAMDEDVPYAFNKHIPILPIMMEPGIDVYYSKPDKFGNLQYLNPYSTDTTEISYGEKLKKYLETVLLSDELARRVRAAFDAYIFLSYRKKDRKLANELMKMIHNNPECRDIAIWFDEFLTPGESFQETIEKILSDCKLFTLLITPQLLEKIVDEKGEEHDNYIISTELPLARKNKEEKGTDIFAVEMEETDKDKLSSINIEEYVNVKDEAFRTRLLDAISKIAITENNTPEHNFLIGLAYIEGIDVEVDRKRGIELISSAAEAGLWEAMLKLYDMYNNGIGTNVDYRKTLYWSQKIVDYSTKEYGEENTNTIAAIANLAEAYGELGDRQKALELNEKAYELSCRISGEEAHYTLIYLTNIAKAYERIGNLQKALELAEKASDLKCKILGEEHQSTLASLNELAIIHSRLGDFPKALNLSKKVYAISCKILGEKHPDSVFSLYNLATTYGETCDVQKAFELCKKAYDLSCEVHGEEHPATIIMMGQLAMKYVGFGDREKALELGEKTYKLLCRIFGEEHPHTLIGSGELAQIYASLGDVGRAFGLSKKMYDGMCRIFGEEHPDTMIALNNLAYMSGQVGDFNEAVKANEKLLSLRCKVLGEEHPDTLTTLNNLAMDYSYLGDFEKAHEFGVKVCNLACKVLGEEHPETLICMSNFAYFCSELGEVQEALALKEYIYRASCEVQGEEHPNTMVFQNNLAEAYAMLGETNIALELLKNLYEKRCKVFGEQSNEVVETLENLVVGSGMARDRMAEIFYKRKLKKLKENMHREQTK